jgi:3-dehydroquinate dehydratase/shikimate dehydrogenase
MSAPAGSFRLRKTMPDLFGKHRICAVIAATTLDEMAQLVPLALRHTELLELRIDYFKDYREFDKFIFWLRNFRQKKMPTFIATCRRVAVGGRFVGHIGDEAMRVVLAGHFGCHWKDISVETAEHFGARHLHAWLGKPKIIVSHHDFQGTPRNLRPLLRRLERAGGEVVKIAAQCNSLRDALRLLALARGRRDVIAVPMGEVGLPARVLALAHGGALAYASVGEKTAPGQLTLEEMKNLYRADKLTKKTRVYGVIGDPVAHSLSPLMHNLAFQKRKLDAVYLPFLVRDLKDFLAAVQPLNIAGFSVTLPHKEAILEHLDDCDPLAARIGAVNTVVLRSGGRLFGCNTDYVGVLRALEKRVPLAGSRVLILGAGGAARAVAFALTQGGAVVGVCSRRAAPAKKLARAVGGEFIERRRLRREFFDAIVNCTPVGMHPDADESPLEAAELNCRLVFDTIYRPMKTRLLRLAEQRGIETVSGVEMFVAQGTAQWEIWTGLRAPVSEMRRAVLAELKAESETTA